MRRRQFVLHPAHRRPPVSIPRTFGGHDEDAARRQRGDISSKELNVSMTAGGSSSGAVVRDQPIGKRQSWKLIHQRFWEGMHK